MVGAQQQLLAAKFKKYGMLYCYTVKTLYGNLVKDFLWDFFKKLRCFSNKKWICYRNIQARWFKLQRGNEMSAILIFVGKLSGNARAPFIVEDSV